MMHASVMQLLEEKAKTDDVAAFALAYIRKLEAVRCHDCHEPSCYGCEAQTEGRGAHDIRCS